MKGLFTIVGVGVLGYLIYSVYKANAEYTDFLANHKEGDTIEEYRKTDYQIRGGVSGLQEYDEVSHDGFIGEFVIKNFF